MGWQREAGGLELVKGFREKDSERVAFRRNFSEIWKYSDYTRII